MDHVVFCSHLSVWTSGVERQKGRCIFRVNLTDHRRLLYGPGNADKVSKACAKPSRRGGVSLSAAHRQLLSNFAKITESSLRKTFTKGDAQTRARLTYCGTWEKPLAARRGLQHLTPIGPALSPILLKGHQLQYINGRQQPHMQKANTVRQGGTMHPWSKNRKAEEELSH